MKSILKITLLMLCVFANQNIKAQGEQYDMTEINDKLELVIRKKLHLLDDPSAFSKLQSDPDFAFVENKCKIDWLRIIDNFQAIEGGEIAKKLVVAALQVLEAGDYMSAIEKVVTRFEAGTVDQTIIQVVLDPEGRMQAFLADNYVHNRVTTALNKIKAKAADEPEIKALIDNILSGESKIGFDEIREDFAGTGYGNIPKVLLAK